MKLNMKGPLLGPDNKPVEIVNQLGQPVGQVATLKSLFCEALWTARQGNAMKMCTVAGIVFEDREPEIDDSTFAEVRETIEKSHLTNFQKYRLIGAMDEQKKAQEVKAAEPKKK
jgi:hypothetical protein